MPASRTAARDTRAFAKVERQRQALFRERSTTISAAARAPSDEKGMRHGHLLGLGYEEENLVPEIRAEGGATGFFADRGIKWHKTASSGDRSGAGPTRNLCSSQVACINTLLPLKDSTDHLLAV